MNPSITESAPDTLTLEIMQAVRNGDLTWQQGEALKSHIQNGNPELARDLLAAWLPS